MKPIKIGSAEVSMNDVPIGIATDIELTFEAPEFNLHPNCFCAHIDPVFLDGKPRYWDIKNKPVYPDEPPERYQMRKWLSQIPHGGIVGCKAALILYNERMPEQSLLIVEDI